MSSGIPPHLLGSGLERHPGWDWLDLEMIQAWRRLDDERCPQCGRPLAVHDEDDVSEYRTGWLTCTAETAIDEARTAWAGTPEGKRAHENGRDRLMHWIAWREAEGRPEWRMK